MCIRAIDYCPPVDIDVRGIPARHRHRRPRLLTRGPGEPHLSFIESFREWGIYPTGISSVGVDALAWPTGEELIKELAADGSVTRKPDALRRDLGQFVRQASSQWNLESDRFAVWNNLARLRGALHDWLLGGDSFGRDYARIFGLEIDPAKAPSTVAQARNGPAVEVHAVRPTIRRTARGMTSADLVIEITQRRDGYYDKDEQERMEALPANGGRKRTPPDFYYRAGATILVDPATGEVRRVIRTPGTIADTPQLNEVRDYLRSEAGLRNAFDGEQPSASS